MTRGVIYWMTGTKLIARLYTSLMSLREVYDGNVTVILNYDVPKEFDEILENNGFDIKHVDLPEQIVGKHKSALLGKTIMNQFTPYDVTTLIDCDTLVIKPFDEMFDWAEEHTFVITQFSNWGTKKGKISKRIRQFGPDEEHGLKIVDEKTIQAAHKYGKGINVGVYSFLKDATIFDDWYDLAHGGMNTFIPDEVSCQILLPKHKHYCAPQYFNSSCRYSIIDDDTRIIHYHGRKHASPEKTRNTGSAELWIKRYREFIEEDRCDFETIVENWPDRHAKKLKG